jgi:homocysteine S-methyltransferase
MLEDDRRYVTDGGLETDLIFHHGVDLPEFASFPLIEQAQGRELLAQYYDGYADIARRAGYDATALDRVNRDSISFLHERRDAHPELHDQGVLVGGMIGPRGDGYVAGDRLTPEEYADYHRPQLASFQGAGADVATALTLVGADEATGIVTAARDVGLPIAVSFTVETDGRLAGGTSLAEAIEAVDAEGGPDWFLVNCAHPTHVARGLAGDGPWERIAGLRPNASQMSHAELDEAEELDEGDPAELQSSLVAMVSRLPGLRILGGCCGTDARHVAALWGL